MRSLACRFWGCAPPQLDQWIEEGRLSFLDVYELIVQLQYDPIVQLWLFQYLTPEAVERATQVEREGANKLTGLKLLSLYKPKNDVEAARIEAMKKELAK